MAVSIHAPARGATASWAGSHSALRFQSTHPHGVRRHLGPALIRPYGFNPRTRTGCDADVMKFPWDKRVSIHAPARGATPCTPPRIRTAPVSIHAPARGATPDQSQDGQAKSVSIHAPARGATRGFAYGWAFGFVSIHAPARGATFVDEDGEVSTYVSIHAPARGATRQPAGHRND